MQVAISSVFGHWIAHSSSTPKALPMEPIFSEFVSYDAEFEAEYPRLVKFNLDEFMAT